jgi:tetratricopeptide (TPR) repeat protein
MKSIKLIIIGYLFFSSHFIEFTHGQPADARVDREVRRNVIDRVSRLLQTNYVFAEKSGSASRFLNEQLLNSAYKGLDHPRSFAQALTKDLQEFLGDKHIRIRELSAAEGSEDPLFSLLYDHYDKYKHNYGIRDVRVYPGNIGYLELQSFEPLELSRNKISAAMKILADVSALIIDLRRNSGGNPVTVQYLCSYLFEQPTHLNSQYWRRGDYTEEFWTFDHVDGQQLGDVPIYILTSQFSFSAAEEFAYDLQVLKRAMVIGETTGGGANPGHSFRIDNRFIVFIPTGRAINPVTQSNWEGVGVQPDIEVSAAKALDIALEKADLSARRYAEKKENHAVKEMLNIAAEINQSASLFTDDPRLAGQKIESALETGLEQKLIDEASINSLGYRFLNQRKIEIALIIFHFNVHKFSESANAYDSLAEAYLKSGDPAKALLNYQKSLKIDPKNQNAKLMIKLIEKQE